MTVWIADCNTNKPLDMYMNGSVDIVEYMKQKEMMLSFANITVDLRNIGIEMQNRVITAWVDIYTLIKYVHMRIKLHLD